MGRPKGFVMTEEQKKAMKEGREKARADKIAQGVPLRTSKKNKIKTLEGKPTLYIKGNETDALDFFPCIREALRPLHRNKECDNLCREIAQSPTWKNIRLTLNRLEEIFNIVEPETIIPKKERKKRKPMTDEQKKVAIDRLAYARSQKGKNKTN
jgi:hypothetical protein